MKPTLETMTGKKHLSYSALDTFQQCGEKFRLTRVLSVPEQQAWWFVGGSAFHTSTEYWDAGDDRPLQQLWQQAWDKEMERVDPDKPFRSGGRATKQWPNKEDGSWWQFNGLSMLENYVRWRQSSGWELYTINDQPLIEWEFLLTLDSNLEGDDTSDAVQIKGFIDRVFVTPDGEVVVVDLKTGSREPASTTQLGIYGAALRKNGGVNPMLGGYYMSRKAETPNLRALTMYTDDVISYWLSVLEDSVREKKFLPHVTSMCQTCMVAPYCYAVGGTPPDGGPFNKGGKQK